MEEILLRCEHVGFKRKNFALTDMNLEVRAGYITVITGSNGAGKSTLLSILSGQNQKYTGEVWLYGYDLRDCKGENSQCTMIEKIGYMSDEPSFFMECDAVENEMFLSPHYTNWNKEFYRQKLNELGVSTSTPIKHLSRGNYIRFQLIWAMAHKAELYFMDEPTAGLDPVYKKEFYKQLQELVEQGAAVVLATNLYEDVEQIADYHIVIEDGKILQDREVAEV